MTAAGRVIEVTTSKGRRRGAVDGDVAVFRNVAYAPPPIGPPRGQPPQPGAAWSGAREARFDGPICPQPPSRLERVVGPFAAEQDEDCLPSWPTISADASAMLRFDSVIDTG